MLRSIIKKSRDVALSTLPIFKQCEPLILCFHTVSGLNDRRGYVSDFRSHPLAVFESQMNWLSTFCEFVSLDEVVEKCTSSAHSRQKVAITFDDGYQDNVNTVLPILEKYDAPVAVFISTKYLLSSKLPWWDFMDWTIEHGYVCDLKSGGISRGSFNAKSAVMQREHFKSICRDGSQKNRDKLIDSMMSKCECEVLNDFMTIEELSQLANTPKTTIGLHTHNHLNTALISKEEFALELGDNLDALEAVTKQDVRYFAYPYGGKEQVNLKYTEVISNLGLRAAFTTNPQCLRGSHTSYNLPRMIVSPRGGLTEFKARVKQVLLNSTF